MTKRKNILTLTGIVAVIAISIMLAPVFSIEARERGDRTHPTERPARDVPPVLDPTPDPVPDPTPDPEPIIVPQELLERWEGMLEDGMLDEVEEEYRAFVEDGVYPTDEEEEEEEDPPAEDPPLECMEESGEEVSDRVRDRVVHRNRGNETDPIVINCDDEEEEEEEPPVEEEEEEEEEDDGGFEATYEEKIAAEIHRLTNVEREKENLVALNNDDDLKLIALSHSEDMAENSYFAHTNLENCDLGCRLGEANYTASAWGENIAWRSSTVLPSAEDLALMFVISWMNSSGHRDNMLSENFTNVGIGIAKAGNHVFATMDFSKK